MRIALHFFICLLLGIVCVLAALGWNSEPPQWPQVWQLLSRDPGLDETDRYILLHIRLPRIILALMTGSALALAGLALQGLFRNPLVDPFVIGVSGGGALGAGLAMLFGFSFQWLWFSSLPLAAFATSLVTMGIVYRLGTVDGKVYIDRLLLAGVAVSSLSSALLSLLLVLKGQGMEQVVYWIMGSFTGRTWAEVILLIPFLAVGLLITALHLKGLNALQLGEEAALHLGIEVEKLKIFLLVATTLLSAAVVSVSGVIGFVGLVVPHISRLIVRGGDFRYVLIPSLLIGSVLLVAADTLARTLLPSQEIPVGIFTAMLGVPFFLALLLKQA